ncbi:hypothetical protein H4Q32_030865 [Labeo rohita]|uniref:Uncharacterized protein n=1 Tax=Labeo rohita TaxID=84645 RepID=A0ABQ8L781_LABRO|nr:hypothetical protein H4Q32_030865 [Labeo rohita]
MASYSPIGVSTDSVDISNSLQSEGGGTEININSSEMAGEILASGDHTYAVRRPVVSPAPQRPFVTSGGGDFSSSSRTTGTMGLACEWFNLSTTGLSDSVIRTIQNARAASTRSLYECKLGVFERWCATKHEIPFQCSVAVVLSFLQDLIDQGKAFSTIKVFLAAISACHIDGTPGSFGFSKALEAISLAYSSKGLVPPPGLCAHSTRGMSTSWALFKGVTLQDICEVASCSSPHTFARFYKLDVTAQTLAHAVLSVGTRFTSRTRSALDVLVMVGRRL